MRTVVYGPEVPEGAPFVVMVMVKDPDGSWRTWVSAEAEPGDKFDVTVAQDVFDSPFPSTARFVPQPQHVVINMREADPR